MTPESPRAAASLILWRRPADPEVFWVRRGPHAPFLAGFHAFPGGRVEAGDHAVAEALGWGATEDGAARWAALRECAEETGALPGLDGQPGGRVPEAARRAWRSGEAYGVEALRSLPGAPPPLDAMQLFTIQLDKMQPAGRWIAPPYLGTPFPTDFFLLRADDALAPQVDPGDPELDDGAWVRPADALAAWDRGEALLAPPTRAILQSLAGDAARGSPPDAAALCALPAQNERPSPIRSGVALFWLRTPTLPPATHTNCCVLGHQTLLVVDPASPHPDEQAALLAHLRARQADGATVRAIALTHHHRDHVGGVAALAAALGVPVWAHPETASRVPFAVDATLEDGAVIELDELRLDVLHTPGHAPGHLCFIERATRTAVVGDMVAGLGTILIAPGDGDMQVYLGQLTRLRGLALSALIPSHGPVLGAPDALLDHYIRHRLAREAKVIAALGAGGAPLEALIERVYADAPPLARAGGAHGLAGLSLRAHLDKLVAEGRAALASDGWRAAAPPAQ